MDPSVNPSHIMQIGSGFWASKVLLSAVEFEVFTHLGGGPKTGLELQDALELHPRATWDFLDTLVAMKFLDRAGEGPDALYSNAQDTAIFLDKNSPEYLGGILEMFNARLYRFWDGLSEALRTGKPQNEIKETGKAVFEELYSDPEKLEGFMNAMTGISKGNFMALSKKFNFSEYGTLLDVGGATGQLCLTVAREHPNIRCTSFDLPPVTEIAQKHIDEEGFNGQVVAVSGDFFNDPLPEADVVTMGMILHDWNLERKKNLIQAAYDALPEGGAFIAIENLIDDARRENEFGLLMSLNMLIEFGDAFDYTGADFRTWCGEVGFTRFEILPLAGPASAAIAYK
ncbi:MAG: methyltransferase [Bacteroidetes bacterium]|nr:methyltransferase [Bacteroidota bacterium]